GLFPSVVVFSSLFPLSRSPIFSFVVSLRLVNRTGTSGRTDMCRAQDAVRPAGESAAPIASPLGAQVNVQVPPTKSALISVNLSGESVLITYRPGVPPRGTMPHDIPPRSRT